jgi:hypothetical protein
LLSSSTAIIEQPGGAGGSQFGSFPGKCAWSPDRARNRTEE